MAAPGGAGAGAAIGALVAGAGGAADDTAEEPASVATVASGAPALTICVIGLTDAGGYGPTRSVYCVVSRIHASYPAAAIRPANASASFRDANVPNSNCTVSAFSVSAVACNPRGASARLNVCAVWRGSGSETTRYSVCELTRASENPAADNCFTIADARSPSKIGLTRIV